MNGTILLLIGAGLALGVTWVFSELKAEKPLLNLRLLLQREILLTNIATVFFAMAWMQFGQIWSLLLQQPTETGVGLGLSASAAGLVMQPQTLMALIGGPVAGWFVVKYGVRMSGVVGSLILTLAWAGAIYKHDTVAFVVVLMLVMGFSSSFLVTVMVSSVAKAAPAHQTGEAIGMLTLVRAIANSIGAIIVFYLLSVSTVAGPDGKGAFPSASAYGITMIYCATGTLLIGLLYWLGYRRQEQESGQPVAFDAQAGQPSSTS